MDHMFPTVGDAPKQQEIQAIAFFDQDGRIHHMHHVIILEGARPIEYETMMQEAIAQAENLRGDISQLKTLHVRDMKNPHVMHRVDMKKKCLWKWKRQNFP